MYRTYQSRFLVVRCSLTDIGFWFWLNAPKFTAGDKRTTSKVNPAVYHEQAPL